MRRDWRIYVKRRKHGSLARHITSQLRHSLVVHPLLRKILDPHPPPPCSTLNSSKYNIFFAVSGGSWKLHVSQTSHEVDHKLSQGKLERQGSHSVFFERQVNCRLHYQPLFGKISPVKKRLIVKLISRKFNQLDTLPYEEFICQADYTKIRQRLYAFTEISWTLYSEWWEP